MGYAAREKRHLHRFQCLAKDRKNQKEAKERAEEIKQVYQRSRLALLEKAKRVRVENGWWDTESSRIYEHLLSLNNELVRLDDPDDDFTSDVEWNPN